MCKDAAEWEPKKNKKKKEQGDIMKKRRPERTEFEDVEPKWVQLWNPIVALP